MPQYNTPESHDGLLYYKDESHDLPLYYIAYSFLPCKVILTCRCIIQRRVMTFHCILLYSGKQYWPGICLGRPILSSAPCGGEPPLCIGKHEVGTYIDVQPFVHTQVPGAWADFFEILQLLIWWRGQRILFHGCLLQPSTIHLRTTASSLPYGLTQL
jgi:hypothetical protein